MGLYKTWHLHKDNSVVLYNTTESINELKELLPNSVKVPNFKSTKRVKEWLTARHITNVLFNKSIIEYEQAKPQITIKPNINISISHSNNMLALAYSSKLHLGVDIQHITDKTLKVLNKFTTQREQTLINNSVDIATLMWTAKEAMYKLSFSKVKNYKEDLQVLSFTSKSISAKIFDIPITLSYFKFDDYYVSLASSENKI